MKRARIVKMKLDELAAVNAGAQAAQGTVVLKRKPDSKKPAPMTSVEKRSALTTATLGHTHLVYGIDDSAAGTTSYESTYVEGGSNDCYTGHCHPWVRNADGSISVGEAMGHTHAIGAMSAELVTGDANKSTRPVAKSQAGPTSKETTTMPTEQEIQIADLTKRNERLERVAKMSGRHKSHFDTLIGEDADAFVAQGVSGFGCLPCQSQKGFSRCPGVIIKSKVSGDTGCACQYRLDPISSSLLCAPCDRGPFVNAIRFPCLTAVRRLIG